MKNFFSALRVIPALVAGLALFTGVATADRLEDIKKAGVLKVASFDANPPFGFVDNKTKSVIGLDVDFAQAIADKLGVKLQIVPTNPANRIPLLVSGQADLVVANFTVSEERASQVEFSIPYFASGQQFIAKKGVLTSPDQLDSMRIGADKGTTNEVNLKKLHPKAVIISYDDTPFAFAALRNGNVQAITQDGPKLVGVLANVPDRDQYEIPAFTISDDYMAVAAPKGEKALIGVVNETLLELEKSGKAEQIYNHWFGPETNTPLPRLFKIGDKQ